MADPFEELRTFVAVVQEEGVSAAAARLGVVKSAVSRRIRDLEDRLGTRLLQRTSRQLRLTELGGDFYERALRVLSELEEAEQSVTQGMREASGRLRVSAPVSFTIHCLVPLLGEFLTLHPRLQLELETNDRLVDLVSEGFDLALRISELKDSTLVARRLAPIRHAVCASPAYLAARGRPTRLSDLAAHDAITYSHAPLRDRWTFKEGQSVRVRPRLEMSNGDALREAAIAGLGLVYLPTFIASRAIQRGELEVLLADHARPPIWLHAVFPTNRHLSAKVRLFIDFLRERFGEQPPWERGLGAHAPRKNE